MLASTGALVVSNVPRLTRDEVTTIASSPLLRLGQTNNYDGSVALPFELEVPRSGEDALVLSIEAGDVLFILGANGTGKSNLMHRFYMNHFGKVRRLSAHRQTWFASNAITLSPDQKRQTESNILSSDKSPDSRWLDHHSAQRPGIAIFDLIDAQNVRARTIATAVDEGNTALSNVLSSEEAPKAVITCITQMTL